LGDITDGFTASVVFGDKADEDSSDGSAEDSDREEGAQAKEACDPKGGDDEEDSRSDGADAEGAPGADGFQFFGQFMASCAGGGWI
jgi:hypothetical protein